MFTMNPITIPSCVLRLQQSKDVRAAMDTGSNIREDDVFCGLDLTAIVPERSRLGVA